MALNLACSSDGESKGLRKQGWLTVILFGTIIGFAGVGIFAGAMKLFTGQSLPPFVWFVGITALIDLIYMKRAPTDWRGRITTVLLAAGVPCIVATVVFERLTGSFPNFACWMTVASCTLGFILAQERFMRKQRRAGLAG